MRVNSSVMLPGPFVPDNVISPETVNEVSVPVEVIDERFPVVITVPSTFGNVIVRSAVGFVTVSVVSFASSPPDPSNTMLESDRYRDDTVGLEYVPPEIVAVDVNVPEIVAPLIVGVVSVLPLIVKVLFVVATTAVSTESVIVPAVPPPLRPVPAVTPEISPSLAVQADPL